MSHQSMAALGENRISNYWLETRIPFRVRILQPFALEKVHHSLAESIVRNRR
ncbi:hypothetical protein SAMN04515672_0508 [Natronorubrum texcoconense]|uniref:Uncharacterized protein n=1 Tax=Natronorubrum texcoconense TaxID=1095776 RepID=A0A1G8TKS2_9EURY|nr:hypothetical protein SAMN04515672_0508 [Natronorubrum texcoconense]